MEGQALFPLKTLMRKTASRCPLLLTWSEGTFNVTKMSLYLKLRTPLKGLVKSKVADFL
jgi:hypothetical protein